MGKLLASARSSYSARFSPYLTASHRGSAKSTATLPFRDSTLAKAIREIDAATAPQPVLPSAFFFKDSVVRDDFWTSKGKRKISELGTDIVTHVGKRATLSPLFEDHPLDTAVAAVQPILHRVRLWC